MQLTIPTPEEMETLGATIAGQLREGDLVLLNGRLGAGKTTLTRGLGAALGLRGAVTSPTFVLARTHPRLDGPPLVHVDAYRLGSAVELDDLDIDFERSIVVVEWGAGLLDGLTDAWLELEIARPKYSAAPPLTSSGTELMTTVPEPVEGADEVTEPRTVTVAGHGARWQDLGWLGAARN
jgi:tRNA threonylcarbamoyladenosine biosynthesis protein TsaE